MSRFRGGLFLNVAPFQIFKNVLNRLIMDPNRVSTVTKSLTELLMSPSISRTHRDLAVDVLQSIIGSTKNAAAQLSTGTILEALILNGILRCPGTQPSSTIPLLLKVIEIASKLKANINSACLTMLPNLATHCSSSIRVAEFFELLHKVSSGNSVDVAVRVFLQRGLILITFDSRLPL